MTYAVKEIFYSLQGEGTHAGRAAVFVRFSGCNLWSGREADRKTAVCRFCDTDFVGTDGDDGGKYADAATLAESAAKLWPKGSGRPYAICTGGEPLLQLDEALIEALHGQGFEIAVETNGTIAAPAGIDWICVSPKAGGEMKQTSGNELKLVYPQDCIDPESFAGLSFERFFLQPQEGLRVLDTVAATVQYCLAHPKWRLSLQIHKFLGIR